MIVSLINQSM